MIYRIDLKENWRHRRGMYTPGVYRVPTDILESLAVEMIETGFAVRFGEPRVGDGVKMPAASAQDWVSQVAELDAMLPQIERRDFGPGGSVVVAGSGPSLTPDVADACAGLPVIAVNDAYKLFPDAMALYACDADWWRVHDGCPEFRGEKWSSHTVEENGRHNNKLETARRYDLRLIEGRDRDGFSFEPNVIHYGSNSGFQAINLALQFGARRVVLVGFDMRLVDGVRHFFGDHPALLRNGGSYANFIRAFRAAAATLPDNIEIVNATPGSGLKCFPMMELKDAIAVTETA